MALIFCPECGKEISDAAGACPHCGYPIQKPQPQDAPPSPRKSKRPIIIAACVLVLVAMVGAFVGVQQKQSSPHENYMQSVECLRYKEISEILSGKSEMDSLIVGERISDIELQKFKRGINNDNYHMSVSFGDYSGAISLIVENGLISGVDYFISVDFQSALEIVEFAKECFGEPMYEDDSSWVWSLEGSDNFLNILYFKKSETLTIF